MDLVTPTMLLVVVLLIVDLVSGQNLYFHPVAGSKRCDRNVIANTDVGYFHKLCTDFKVCTAGTQFAVLTIGDLPDSAFNPIPKTKGECDKIISAKEKKDFAVAVPKKIGKKMVHTEIMLLDGLTKMKDWVVKKDGVDVYLFTYFSPCKVCAKAIVDKIDEQKNLGQPIKIHLSWQVYFHGAKPNWKTQAFDFFESLKILFAKDKTQLVIHWDNDKKACGEFERLSYQYMFYECLLKTVTEVENCHNLPVDLAKFVNKLTYNCRQQMDKNNSNLKDCIIAFIRRYSISKKGKKLFFACIPNQKWPLVGPPLDLAAPQKGSQTMEDLTGDYKNDFCFKEKPVFLTTDW